RVAVKLIKTGMDSKAMIARFESERQALALMEHPAIAKVFDAGTTPEGQPYFVMEYVPGPPITEYCDRNREHPRPAGVVHSRLRRRAARAPEGHHPPRPEALQRAGRAPGWEAGPQDHRFRGGQGDGAEAHGQNNVNGVGRAGGHAREHEHGTDRHD